MSPRWPYWPIEPPLRWMQATRFAPELSATSCLVPFWILAYLSSARRITLRTRHRLSRDSGRLASISTLSPRRHSFVSSWA